MTVDIVCRVVDNLGDIGFVYRLARALSELPDAPSLRLIVDDLAAFAGICPGVDPDACLQTVQGWPVVRWDDPGADALRLYRANPPRMVLECYACGRPAWFESILFDENDTVQRHIVNLEYLTAESWARDFHRLPSLTRSPLVRKTIFMPGFEAGTGGLLQDASFNAMVDACENPETRQALRSSALESLESLESHNAGVAAGQAVAAGKGQPAGDPASIRSGVSSFWFFLFSYEHDFSSIVGDLASFHAGRPLLALVAAGRSSRPFLDAWERSGRPFPVLVLPLLAQGLWDQFLAASDFAIVRGEETFARACLAGRPFLWQCYPFAEDSPVVPGAGESSVRSGASDTHGHGGQLPKVYAFLDRIRPFLAPADFAAYERLTLHFNGAEPSDGASRRETGAGELLAVLRALGDPDDRPGLDYPPAGGKSVRDGLSGGFRAWSREIRTPGNLAVNLLTFMRDLG